jgi:RNA polymerase sigma-70 factor, ECF subfamily
MPSTISQFSQNHRNKRMELSDFWEQARRHVVKKVDSPQVAEDIASEAVTKILAAEQNGNGSTDHWSGWAWQIVHNLIIDYYRQRQRRFALSLDTLMTDSEEQGTVTRSLHAILRTQPFDDAVHDQIEIECMLRSVRLTELQVQVANSVFIQGYEPAEVGEMTGRTEGAVKALMHRARTTLRQIYHTG